MHPLIIPINSFHPHQYDDEDSDEDDNDNLEEEHLVG